MILQYWIKRLMKGFVYQKIQETKEIINTGVLHSHGVRVCNRRTGL